MLKLQRAGCLLGVLAFVLFPNANLLARNKNSLFVVCVANTVLVNGALAAVSLTSDTSALHRSRPQRSYRSQRTKNTE